MADISSDNVSSSSRSIFSFFSFALAGGSLQSSSELGIGFLYFGDWEDGGFVGCNAEAIPADEVVARRKEEEEEAQSEEADNKGLGNGSLQSFPSSPPKHDCELPEGDDADDCEEARLAVASESNEEEFEELEELEDID